MALMFIACDDYIADEPCTVVIGAETAEDVIESAVEHGYSAHGEEDTPALRQQIRDNLSSEPRRRRAAAPSAG